MSIISKDRDENTLARLETLFEVYENGLNGLKNEPISSFRRTGFKTLQESRFPTRKDEDWKYTNVNPILKVAYQTAIPQELDQKTLDSFLFEGLDAIKVVLVNGILSKSLSDLDTSFTGLQLMRLEEALKNENLAARIETLNQQKGGTEINTFLALNRAFSKQGFFVASERNCKIEKPIHFIYINTSGKDVHFSHPQLYIDCKESSNLTIIESYHCTSEHAEYFNNTANYIAVGKNANLEHYRLQFDSKKAFQIHNTIATQDRDSVYSNYAVDLGGQIVRNNLSTELLSSGTQTNYLGAYLGLGDQHIDNQTFIDHAMPHCQSNEIYKGILTDKARGVFNGKVLVRQDAQKTNAFQQSSSLVLSNTAIMDAKPQLEIYADDVKCSHGATIGQLDDNSVFYLRTRGLSEEGAKNLLQKAFMGDVVTKFKLAPIRDKVLARIEDKLSRI